MNGNGRGELIQYIRLYLTVKGRNADQAVDASFRATPGESMLPSDLDGGAARRGRLKYLDWKYNKKTIDGQCKTSTLIGKLKSQAAGNVTI